MVGRDSLQYFWVNLKMTDSYPSHFSCVFLTVVDWSRSLQSHPSAFAVSVYDYAVILFELKKTLRQVHDISFLCFTLEKCKVSTKVIHRFWKAMPSEGENVTCSFPEPLTFASVPWSPLLILIKHWIFCLAAFSLLYSVMTVFKRWYWWRQVVITTAKPAKKTKVMDN